MEDRDTGTQEHQEGSTDKVKGTQTQDQHGEGLLGGVSDVVQDAVKGTVSTVQDTVKGTLSTVQDVVGDVKDML